MTNTVGAIQVDLQANTAAFQADMGRAAAALQTSTAQMKLALNEVSGAIGSLRSGAALLGVSLGVGAIASFVSDAVHAAAELKNLSIQLGVSTDALQAYRFGAVQSGISSQELDTGIGRLSRTIGEAARGNDAAIQTFRDLKVGILDANKQILPTEEIFRRVATALANMKDPAQRIRLEVALFGRDGARFGALVKDGAAGLDEFSKAAKDAGAIVSIELIEKFDESSNKIAKWKIQGQVAAVEGVGWFAELSDSIGEALRKLNEFYGAWGAYAVASGRPPSTPPPAFSGPLPPAPGAAPLPQPPKPRPLAPAGDTAANGGLPESESDKARRLEADALVRSLELERDSAGKLKDQILQLKLSRELDIAATAKQGAEVKKFTDAQVAAAVAVQKQIDSRADLQADIDRDRERRDLTLALTQAQQLQTDQINEQAAAAAQSRVVWDEVSKSYRVNADELLIVTKQQEILNQHLDVTTEEARTMAEAYAKAVEKLRSSSAAAETNLRRTQAAISEVDNFTEQVFDHIGQGVTTAFAEGETAADRFHAVVSSVLTEIQGELFKLALVNPLKNALFGSNSPTISDVGGLLGGIGSRGSPFQNQGAGTTTSVGALTPEQVAGLAGPSNDNGSPDVVKAIAGQTGEQSGFFGDLGKNFGASLQSLGGFLGQGLQLIVSAIESLAALAAGSSGSGGLGGAGGLLGLFGGGAAGGAEAGGVVEAGAATGGEEALLIAAAADGTDFAPGGPTLVGEEGPEILNLPRGSQVIPNGVTSSLLSNRTGGGGTTIVADLRGASVEAVQRLESYVAAINASLEHRAVAATYDAMRRGGRYSAAFKSAAA